MAYSNNFFVKLIRFASQVLCFVAQLMLFEALLTGALRIELSGGLLAIDTVFGAFSRFSDGGASLLSLLAVAQSICFIVFTVKMLLVILRSFRYFGGKDMGKMYGMNRSLGNTLYLFVAFIFFSTMFNFTSLTIEAKTALEFSVKTYLGVRVLYWILHSFSFGFILKETFMLALCALAMFGICSFTLYSPVYSIAITLDMGMSNLPSFALPIAGGVLQIIIMSTVLRLLSLWLINQGKKNFSSGNERAFCWKRLRKTAFFLILVQVAFFLIVGNGMDMYVSLPEYLLSYNKVVYVWLLAFVGKWIFRVGKSESSYSSSSVRASKPAKKSATSKSKYKPYKKRFKLSSIFRPIGKFFSFIWDIIVLVALWIAKIFLEFIGLIGRGVEWVVGKIKGKSSSSKAKSKTAYKASNVKAKPTVKTTAKATAKPTAKVTGKPVVKSAVKSVAKPNKVKTKVVKPKRLTAKERMILAIQSMPKGEIYNLTAGDIFGVEVVDAV
jgi:hypothetical protein